MPGVRPLRILHVLRSPVGGLFRHVIDLARAQAARGHPVGIVADSSTGGARADVALAALSGELAILASAATGAVCSVLYRPYLARYPTLPVSAFAMMAAALALLVPAALDDLFVAPGALSRGAWAAIVFIGLSSGGGYVLWLWALKNIAATRVTVFLALSPITAAALGVTVLGEAVTVGMMVGVACVAAGLWLAGGE